MKRKTVCLALALLMGLMVCSGPALAYCQPEAAAAEGPLYCHGSGHHGGGHGGHGGHGRHRGAESCDWLFHACGDCADVNCTEEAHAHRCPADCADEEHQHYGVCRYADGTLALTAKRA